MESDSTVDEVPELLQRTKQSSLLGSAVFKKDNEKEYEAMRTDQDDKLVAANVERTSKQANAADRW